jgi:hypothetical protein
MVEAAIMATPAFKYRSHQFRPLFALEDPEQVPKRRDQNQKSEQQGTDKQLQRESRSSRYLQVEIGRHEEGELANCPTPKDQRHLCGSS